MVRTSLWSLGLLVLAGAATSPAEESAPADKEGFRVYTIGLRCQARRLVGVYQTNQEAFRVAADLRTRHSPERVLVTTGSEGKNTPSGRPALYHLYAMTCTRSGWQKQPLLVDEKKVQEAVKAQREKGARVEVIHDYAPREVYHVYGGGCRRPALLLGSYLTVREACEAAQEFRTKQRFFCTVTTGTKGEERIAGTPARYTVYVQGCKGGWSEAVAAAEWAKVQEYLDARKDKASAIEVVHHLTTK